MQADSRQAEFLDHLYAAAVGADEWENVLASYTRLVGGHAGLLNYYDLGKGVVRTVAWHNYDQKHITGSDSYWQAREPWSPLARQEVLDNPALLAGGFVTRGSRLMPQRQLLASEWYNEFGAESLVQDFLATTGVGTGMRGLSLASNIGGHPPATYSDEQVRLAASVGPDVQRAIALHIKTSAGGQILSASPGFASMTLPVLAIQERCVLTANAPALQELERGRLFRSQGGRLVAQDPELARMLVAVARKDENHQMSMVATANDGSRFLAQAVRFNQLRGTLMAAAGADDPAVMLVLTSLDQGTAGRAAAIKSLGSFTPVEHAIAVALVNGQSIEDIARERRTSVQTIRWHLRNMSDKTGQHGSKGLTRMLTLLLPY